MIIDVVSEKYKLNFLLSVLNCFIFGIWIWVVFECLINFAFRKNFGEFVFEFLISCVDRGAYSVKNVRKFNEYRTKLEKFHKEKADYEFWDIRSKETYWRSLNGIQFEQELGNIYRKLGFSVEITPFTADGGVDLIIKKMGKQRLFNVKLIRKRYQ